MTQLTDARLIKFDETIEAATKGKMLLIEDLQKDKIVDVNNLITAYHIRKSQLSKAAQKMLATRKSKAGTGKQNTKKKTSKKSGKKKVTTSKNSTANTA